MHILCLAPFEVRSDRLGKITSRIVVQRPPEVIDFCQGATQPYVCESEVAGASRFLVNISIRCSRYLKNAAFDREI